jgi:hypothetical protein
VLAVCLYGWINSKGDYLFDFSRQVAFETYLDLQELDSFRDNGFWHDEMATK